MLWDESLSSDVYTSVHLHMAITENIWKEIMSTGISTPTEVEILTLKYWIKKVVEYHQSIVFFKVSKKC
jgi:hypothetical protein